MKGREIEDELPSQSPQLFSRRLRPLFVDIFRKQVTAVQFQGVRVPFWVCTNLSRGLMGFTKRLDVHPCLRRQANQALGRRYHRRCEPMLLERLPEVVQILTKIVVGG